MEIDLVYLFQRTLSVGGGSSIVYRHAQVLEELKLLACSVQTDKTRTSASMRIRSQILVCSAGNCAQTLLVTHSCVHG